MEEQTVIPDNIETQAPKERQRRAVGINGTYECDQCHKIYSGRGALYNHKQSDHQGVKYACNQCDYQATTQGSLTVHIQSKHEGVKYACNQCDYQATTQSNLARHIQSKH